MQKNNLNNKPGLLQFLYVPLFIIVCVLTCSFPLISYAKTITIAVVKDGDSPFFDARIKGVIHELELLVGTGNRLKIRELPKFNAQWDIKKVPRALKAAMSDPKTDIIYSAGFLVTEAAAQKGFRLKKPVVAGIIHDGRFMGMVHDKKGRSQKHNLSYIDIPGSIKEDIYAFHELTGFKTLHFLVDEKIVKGSVHAADYIKSIEKEKNIKIKIIKAKTSVDSVLDQLDNGVEAVYITPLIRMNMNEALAVVKGINSKKIPSFALLGRPAVESGVLAGRLPEMEERVCRRLALNIHQIIMGESPENLNVTMSIPATLLLNIETAHKIGFSPDFAFLISKAELIGNRPESTAPSLTLEQAMEMASETNIDIAIQKELVESSLQASEKTGTYMRPQVYGNGQYLQIDSDRAESSMGSAAERKTTIGAL
ncbi:hypothetical protein QUF70_20170, partial [Desulfobacterales bacterium HSG17]|nr:hypothetical protein [Desulfobacterales bacterium HSG17]